MTDQIVAQLFTGGSQKDKQNPSDKINGKRKLNNQPLELSELTEGREVRFIRGGGSLCPDSSSSNMARGAPKG